MHTRIALKTKMFINYSTHLTLGYTVLLYVWRKKEKKKLWGKKEKKEKKILGKRKKGKKNRINQRLEKKMIQ